MSKVIEEVKEPIVWTVEAHSWTCNIPMDAYNSSFDMPTQAYEAATKAVEAFKGKRNDIILLMKEGHDKLTLGGGLRMYPKDSDPKNAIPCYTYVPLADAGFYKESWEMYLVIKKKLEEHQQKQQEMREQAIEQLEKVLKPKRPRKKKTGNDLTPPQV